MPTPVDVARQCLTDEAARALDDAISVARRRTHSQTTSLHVVSSLLSYPSSLLREACARARSHACHTRLQFRALDLSVGVSLDRLPTTRSHPDGEKDAPPVSNSLMAAIRRSQANQRRHPESFYLYQQSASVLKVELKHFVLSILDDPIVSRVLGEAGFRSYDIKLAILHPPVSPLRRPNNRSSMFVTNFPESSRFQFHFGPSYSSDDTLEENFKRIASVMKRKPSDKRNILLVGYDSINVINSFVDAVSHSSSSREVLLGEIGMLKVISLGENEGDLKTKFAEFREEVERCDAPGVLFNFGEMKRFVCGDALAYWNVVISEMKALTEKYSDKVWLIGAVSSFEAFAAFAYKFPEVEGSLNLHIVQMAPSFESFANSSNSSSRLMRSFIPFGGFFAASDEVSLGSPYSTSQVQDGSARSLRSIDAERNCDDPFNLGKLRFDTGISPRQSHGSENLRSNQYMKNYMSVEPSNHPSSSNSNSNSSDAVERSNSSQYDADVYKSVMRALTDRLGRRQEKAIRAISEAVSRRHGGKGRQSIWMNILGPDTVGKKVIASTLAEVVYSRRESLISMNLNPQERENRSDFIINTCESMIRDKSWGRTVVDELGETVKRNPSSVILLDGLEKADVLVQRSLTQAIKHGKFRDSYGREIGINNAIIVTTSSKPYSQPELQSPKYSEEEVLKARKWQMKLSVEPVSVSKKRKREDGPERAFFDLNLPVEEMKEESDSGESVSDNESWLEEYRALVDVDVRMNPFDFDEAAEKIKKMIIAEFVAIYGSAAVMEVTHEAMVHMLAAHWDSCQDNAAGGWIARVVKDALVEARGVYAGLGDDVIVTLAVCKGVAMKSQVDGICLPVKINV